MPCGEGGTLRQVDCNYNNPECDTSTTNVLAVRIDMQTLNHDLSKRHRNRREFLRDTGVVAATLAIAGSALADDQRPKQGVTFSFGTYGMKSLKTEDAIRTIAKAGYDGVEIAARPDWDSAPSRMSAERRSEVRTLLNDSDLLVTALMEHLFPTADDTEHQAGLARLREVAKLGHDLAPASPPLIQTVLGGGKWEEKKALFRDRLGDWAELAKDTQTIIAIKPHRGGGMSKPSEGAWLIEQLGNTPWLRLVYDYSHYAFREMSVADTVATALPYTGHIAIKDTVQTDKGFRFVLPGDSGTFDYADLFKQFYSGGYRGDICCEVSSMVSSQSDYDPVAAAKTCYTNISPLFETAGVSRRKD